MVTADAPLPFALLPPCKRNRSRGMLVSGSHCHPINTKSATWRAQEAQLPAQLPAVPDSAVVHACGPLRVHTAQHGIVPLALSNFSFWSSWLQRSSHNHAANHTAKQLRQRCEVRLRGWRPRICQLSRIYIAGASQVLFNATSYFGSAPRVAAGLNAHGIGAVQAQARHVVLTRNEYGAGYYHMVFDSLASIAFLWPVLRQDPSAKVVLNTCSTGREHLTNSMRTTAPALDASCEQRPYATALLSALGVSSDRVMRWPYTRQLSGPALWAEHASFMCAHPWRSTFHRDFWYVRQLRKLLHAAFDLQQADAVHTSAASGLGGSTQPRLLLLISRKGCTADGCDPSRNVRSGQALLAALRREFPADNVLAFTGNEPVAEQARLFHRATLVAGPHGAAFANMIFCRAGASLIEFHRLRWRAQPNSPIYALLARSLHLLHWVIADTTTESSKRGYEISPHMLVETARAAIAVADGSLNEGNFVVELPIE